MLNRMVTGLRLMAIATVSLTLLSTAGVSPALADVMTEAQADEWFEEAEALYDRQGDFDEVLAAYERAFNAYRSLDDRADSLKAVETLFWLNNEACQYEQAIAWASQALELFPSPESSMTPTDDARYYKFWTENLGRAYRQQGQWEQVIETFAAGLQFIERLPSSAETDLRADFEADLLRGGLIALASHSNSFAEVESMQQRFVEASQRSGVIQQMDRLLSDANLMSREPVRSPELLRTILHMSRQYDYESGELQALMLLGNEAWHRGDLAEAINRGEEALALAEQLAESDAYVITVAGSLVRLYMGAGQDERAAQIRQDYEDMRIRAEGDWAVASFPEPLQLPLPRLPILNPPLYLRMSPWRSRCNPPSFPSMLRPETLSEETDRPEGQILDSPNPTRWLPSAPASQ